MGETSTQTRHEIEGTRRDLEEDLSGLRDRAGALGERGRRAGLRGGGVAFVVAVAGAAALLMRRRRGGVLTAASRRLPRLVRSPVTPAARRADRTLSAGAERARETGERASRSVLRRYADERAQAEKRRNPMWRRTSEAALKAGAAALATQAATQLVRRGLGGRAAPGSGGPNGTGR